jgi:hypothetical protein
MVTSKFLLALLPLAFMTLTTAASVDAEENDYIVFKSGVYLPQAGNTKNFRTGFNFEVAFGNLFSPDIATELEIGFIKTRHTTPDPEKIKTTLNVFPLAWSFKKLFSFQKGEYYGIGGFGVYYIRRRQSDAGHEYVDRETDVGFHAGLGLHYNITQSSFAGIDGMYLFFSDRPFGKYKMDGIIATVFFGLRF